MSVYQKEEIASVDWYTDDCDRDNQDEESTQPNLLRIKVGVLTNSQKTKMLDEIAAPAVFTTVDYVLFDTKKPSDEFTVVRGLTSADFEFVRQSGCSLRLLRTETSGVSDLSQD